MNSEKFPIVGLAESVNSTAVRQIQIFADALITQKIPTRIWIEHCVPEIPRPLKESNFIVVVRMTVPDPWTVQRLEQIARHGAPGTLEAPLFGKRFP